MTPVSSGPVASILYGSATEVEVEGCGSENQTQSLEDWGNTTWFDLANNSAKYQFKSKCSWRTEMLWCELKWVKCQKSMSSFFRRKFLDCISWFHDSGLACSNTSQALSLHFRNFDWSVFLVGHAAMLMMMRFFFRFKSIIRIALQLWRRIWRTIAILLLVLVDNPIPMQ